MTKTLWRELLYRRLATINLPGKILDLGGSRRSGYHRFFTGGADITVANLERDDPADLAFDLEQPFPVPDASYDGLLCLNVLEHIFNYGNVLAESRRVLKPGGTIILAVPFLIQIHPSPRDHWRFTGDTLERIFAAAGFREVAVETIGTGPFGAAYQLTYNLYRLALIQWGAKRLVQAADALVCRLRPRSFLSPVYYPLGYVIIARK